MEREKERREMRSRGESERPKTPHAPPPELHALVLPPHSRAYTRPETDSPLMEDCSKIRLEEDLTSAMNISATPIIDSATFSARPSTSSNDKHNGKPIPVRGKKHPLDDKQNTGRAYVSEFAEPSQPPNSHGNQIDPNLATLGVVVQSSLPQSFGLINVDGKNFWILDSSATDYLTGSSEHFVSYIPCAMCHNRNFSTRLCGTCLAQSASQPFENRNPRSNSRYDVASLPVLGKMFL
ncbi:uncharacterized protein E5676_scaffold799G00090 [Cucumis melo var. makuwa]|uniref:Uncharacterized protein n=1 Tax=Cucumis melo var. makuwa TaxID=1194695 RepID=A0A5A7SQM6_CUCMM|nr:uncharacterized protein E6C27_scaffold81G00090 [Cucumis melo var. makuwa]TYK30565.1 uncharacterized protein E5676_scaffold799G00090 [Cucumis melo var. makuwa]